MGKLRKSILVLGDSLCFGRPDHGILRKDTWPYLTRDFLNLICVLELMEVLP